MKSQDRKALIRLASSLPKGSEERKAILTGLQKQGAEYKLTHPEIRTYLNDPGRCPYCGSTSLGADAFDAEDDSAWRVVECDNCESRWEEVYQIRAFDPKNGPRVDVEDLPEPPTPDSPMGRALESGLKNAHQKQGADPFAEVMKDAVRLFGNRVTLDEEMDGNIVIVVDEREAERKYRQWSKIWPKGEMVEDGIATGVYG